METIIIVEYNYQRDKNRFFTVLLSPWERACCRRWFKGLLLSARGELRLLKVCENKVNPYF